MTQDSAGDYETEVDDGEEEEYEEYSEGQNADNNYSNNYMSDKVSRRRRIPST